MAKEPKIAAEAGVLVLILVVSVAALNLAVFFGYSGLAGKIPAASPPPDYAGLGKTLESLTRKEVILASPISEFQVKEKDLQEWLEPYDRSYTGRQELRFNQEALRVYLEKLSQKINRPPVDARLIINEGRAGEFAPHQNGFKLNVEKSTANIMTGLAKSRTTSTSFVDLAITEMEPDVTLDKVNNLGINALLGSGESDFGGSPKARTHNIYVGSKIFNGIILKPGETFSFNNLLGPVDASVGYLPELVIRDGKLISEYGGGLCQVSTTLFRAAAFAGLPIIERRPHSLPVRYYNPQGFDATIYPGQTDLKFKNDTPTHVLIQTKIVGTQIYFEIYGTADGRKVAVDGPRQYDIQASGAMKAVLNRAVTYADGTEKKDEFRSSYKSPSLFPTVRNPLE